MYVVDHPTAASLHLIQWSPCTLTTCSRNYEYLGCFKDNKNDRVLGAKLANDTDASADVRKPPTNNTALNSAVLFVASKHVFSFFRMTLRPSDTERTGRSVRRLNVYFALKDPFGS